MVKNPLQTDRFFQPGGYLRRKVQPLGQLLQVLAFGRGVHLDGQQRGRIDLGGQLGAGPGGGHDTVKVHGFVHLADHKIACIAVGTGRFQFAENALDFGLIDLAVGLGMR